MSGRRRRTYESPLRAEQADRTREKLLEAAVDLVVDAGGEELTVRRVAARAGVSVPTAYRYFPDRDTLVEMVASSVASRVIGPEDPSRAEHLPTYARESALGFEANDRIMRAQLNTPAGRSLRHKYRKKRDLMALAAIQRSFPSASPDAQRRLAALIRALINVQTWVNVNDHWGMSGAEAGETIAWAVATLVDAMHRDPRGLSFTTPAADAAEPGPAAKPAREKPSRRAGAIPKSAAKRPRGR